MRGLAAAILVTSICSAPLAAQERDRFFARISLALQQPSPIVRDIPLVESASPTKLGIFTLMPPTSRGEIVRVSIPIGELVMRAASSVGAANRRRQEAAARRRVDAELEWFAEQQRLRAR